MIQQFLDSALEVVIQSGFLYVPLLFDPSVDRELHTPPESHSLIPTNGRLFVRAVSVQSVLENYPTIFPESYERLRNACLHKYSAIRRLERIPLDGKLKTILFDVMPHFIRGHKGFERRRLSEGEILDLIERKISTPASCYQKASALVNTDVLRGLLKALGEHRVAIAPLRDGLTSAREVGEWTQKAIERKIVEGETARVKQLLEGRKTFGETEKRRIAVLLHLAEKGSLEIDHFGFSRIGSDDEYFVYKRTGEYALKDYYGRLYLFPDCRVVVCTHLSQKPVVMENYKHPFLEAHDAGQEICLRGFTSPAVFSGSAMIRALEEGINALLYGYSSRRRNGYNNLERMPNRLGSLGFGDSPLVGPTDYPVIRKAHLLDVDFDDYRVSKDHPKIASGQVEVTNDFTP